ncbi:hypothetical protein GLYMA_02G160550v4 [Glycine max]|nr:hypothetical protein GLYMA_02G160550v4 [Glycine max]KAH1060606.1 hypothetical protein GYH30_004193 [Glycine max]
MIPDRWFLLFILLYLNLQNLVLYQIHEGHKNLILTATAKQIIFFCAHFTNDSILISCPYFCASFPALPSSSPSSISFPFKTDSSSY